MRRGAQHVPGVQAPCPACPALCAGGCRVSPVPTPPALAAGSHGVEDGQGAAANECGANARAAGKAGTHHGGRDRAVPANALCVHGRGGRRPLQGGRGEAAVQPLRWLRWHTRGPCAAQGARLFRKRPAKNPSKPAPRLPTRLLLGSRSNSASRTIQPSLGLRSTTRAVVGVASHAATWRRRRPRAWRDRVGMGGTWGLARAVAPHSSCCVPRIHPRRAPGPPAPTSKPRTFPLSESAATWTLPSSKGFHESLVLAGRAQGEGRGAAAYTVCERCVVRRGEASRGGN